MVFWIQIIVSILMLLFVDVSLVENASAFCCQHTREDDFYGVSDSVWNARHS